MKKLNSYHLDSNLVYVNANAQKEFEWRFTRVGYIDEEQADCTLLCIVREDHTMRWLLHTSALATVDSRRELWSEIRVELERQVKELNNLLADGPWSS